MLYSLQCLQNLTSTLTHHAARCYILLYGSALLALPSQYAEQGLCNGTVSVRSSVCPSVPRVCCCGPGG